MSHMLCQLCAGSLIPSSVACFIDCRQHAQIESCRLCAGAGCISAILCQLRLQCLDGCKTVHACRLSAVVPELVPPVQALLQVE